jgi:hypothetical protein
MAGSAWWHESPPPLCGHDPANGTRDQVPAILATSDGSGSAQGTPRDALPRTTMNGWRKYITAWLAGKGGRFRRAAFQARLE